MKYIATGSYLEEKYFEPQNRRPVYYGAPEEQLSFTVAANEYYKRHNKKFIASVFGCVPWTDDFLFNDCYATYRPWDSGDDVMLRNYALPWLKSNPGWNLSIICFQGLDEIGDRGCPSYLKSENPRSSKHSYIKFLDGLIGEIIEFLKKENLWEETYLIITSDREAHLGCSWLAKKGVRTNNWWGRHSKPWDCEVWDFKRNKSTGVYAGAPDKKILTTKGQEI
ncbi:MAG TPA: hypothetical protein ENF20_04910 [Candidatus Marinimicrobia bacterium]|nr:hypothetical protein [Candidatus Neomarinimicrobiota bacterium]